MTPLMLCFAWYFQSQASAVQNLSGLSPVVLATLRYCLLSMLIHQASVSDSPGPIQFIVTSLIPYSNTPHSQKTPLHGNGMTYMAGKHICKYTQSLAPWRVWSTQPIPSLRSKQLQCRVIACASCICCWRLGIPYSPLMSTRIRRFESSSSSSRSIFPSCWDLWVQVYYYYFAPHLKHIPNICSIPLWLLRAQL